MRKLLIYIGISFILSSTGCAVHRPDVQQGNIIEKRELDKLKAGMSRKQVIFLLGNPMLRDTFHKDRWDYVYTLKSGETDAFQQHSMTLYFKKDKLSKIENRGYPNAQSKAKDE